MKHPRIFLMIMLTAALIILMCPIHADTGTQAVLYQSTFATDPHWTTNNPSTDYWDPSAEHVPFRYSAKSPAIMRTRHRSTT